LGIEEIKLEETIFQYENYISALPNGPKRFDIEANLFYENEVVSIFAKLDWMKNVIDIIPLIMLDKKHTFTSIKDNPNRPIANLSEEFISEFKEYAGSLGISTIGFTKVPKSAIFRGKSILFENAFVFSMEMDHFLVSKAPSVESLKMFMGIYYKLGNKINKLTTFLRKNNIAAQAGHPLNGLSIYPVIGHKANLGWFGRHGVLITPEFGPRHRLGIIYTSIDNWPKTYHNPHEWIRDYCAKCGKCISKCPPKAIFENPVVSSNGVVSHIDTEKCFKEFAHKQGCSICIKNCIFNKKSYQSIYKNFTSRKADNQ
jgi:NAD-dependent dihydropyrimidine dehydrogenase PreA subunit